MAKHHSQPSLERFRQRRRQAAEHWRNRLAHVDALPQLTFLGLITGLLAGLIIVGFRLVVEIPLNHWLPVSAENFEALAPAKRFFLPVVGGLGIAMLLAWQAKPPRATGVVHVLDRLHNYQGRLPRANFLNQFIGGALALMSGHSAGREGPAVHLGAATASQLGQWLQLPNNSLRPLVACGVAAAIAASFNTPMAGVIFAMEVVLMEYTIAGFIPVILAAVVGATLTQLVFGPDIVFISGQQLLGDLGELPIMATMGLLVAIGAATYIRLHTAWVDFTRRWPLVWRLSLAGLIGGVGGVLVPQVMGMGYDTIDAALAGEFTWQLLLVILVAKLLITGAILGLGVPGGVIGPCLVMGACLGGAAGHLAELLPVEVSEPGVYVILGMAAMMGAVLNAPLAAMVAILELTYNPGIIFPGMLVVVVACLSTRWLFRCDGLFTTLLEMEGKSHRPKLMQQLLSRTGVRSLMHRRFCLSEQVLTRTQARAILKLEPEWIVLASKALIIEPQALARSLDPEVMEDSTTTEEEDGESLDLLAIPAKRLEMAPISPNANLYEAWLTLNQGQMDALYVPSPGGGIAGLLTRDQIETYYRL